MEKNKALRIINHKDHISKVPEARMNMHWRKLIKNNREGKMRIQLIVNKLIMVRQK
jgi:hypothetical protein